MIFFPDILGSYQKGREEGIRNNWRDLASYEQIEQQRNYNDRMALQNNLLRAQLPLNVSMLADKASTSQRGQLVEQSALPGLIDRANLNSLQANQDLSLFTNNRSGIYDARNNDLGAKLGQMNLNSATQNMNTQYGQGLLAPYQAKDENGNIVANSLGQRQGRVNLNRQDALITSQENNRDLDRRAIDIQNTANTLVPTAQSALSGSIAENQLRSVNGQPAPVSTIASNTVGAQVDNSKAAAVEASGNVQNQGLLNDRIRQRLTRDVNPNTQPLSPEAVSTTLGAISQATTPDQKAASVAYLLNSGTPPDQYMKNLAIYDPQMFNFAQKILDEQDRGNWDGKEEWEKRANENMQVAPSQQQGEVTPGNMMSAAAGGGAAPAASTGTTASEATATSAGQQGSSPQGVSIPQTGSYVEPANDDVSRLSFFRSQKYEIPEKDVDFMADTIQDMEAAGMAGNTALMQNLYDKVAERDKDGNLLKAGYQMATQIDQSGLADLFARGLKNQGKEVPVEKVQDPLQRTVRLSTRDSDIVRRVEAIGYLDSPDIASPDTGFLRINEGNRYAIGNALEIVGKPLDQPSDKYIFLYQKLLSEGKTEQAKRLERVRYILSGSNLPAPATEQPSSQNQASLFINPGQEAQLNTLIG